MKLPTFIEARVAGIPARLRVDSFHHVRGSFSYNAPSDLDYSGYTDCEFTVCDRRGRPAPWLERKLSPAEHSELESLVIERMLS